MLRTMTPVGVEVQLPCSEADKRNAGMGDGRCGGGVRRWCTESEVETGNRVAFGALGEQSCQELGRMVIDGRGGSRRAKKTLQGWALLGYLAASAFAAPMRATHSLSTRSLAGAIACSRAHHLRLR